METQFWHNKWRAGEIGFHQDEVNTLLKSHLSALGIKKGGRIFVPLCGKTLDIKWLLDNGYEVAGAELSELAIMALFEDLGVQPQVSQAGNLKRFHSNNVDLFVGDIFELTGALLGPVDAIYDRAALVALPPAMRAQYSAHLVEITSSAPQLLITFEYDQDAIDGPPFSLDTEEINRQYADKYDLHAAQTRPVDGGLKGKIEATETAWLLRRNC
ncbi:thiopurine S-methyltransferase [Ketobacter sp.]|nr:MAG: thiopurine S-methyltransferase [Ketobacter sp.]